MATYRIVAENHGLEKPEVSAMELVKEARKIAWKLYRIEEEMTRLTDHLQLRVESGNEVGTPALDRRKPSQVGGAMKVSAQILESLAQKGIEKIRIGRRGDGSATVEIEQYPEVRLPSMLADLLEILCTDPGSSGDGLVGYKSPEEMALRLGKRADRPLKKHAVIQNVFRLRRILEQNGGNRYLVQSNNRRGYRFALKKKATLVINGDRE